MSRSAGIVMLICWLLGTAPLPGAPRRLDAFGRIMVLEQGRKKPLDTFARNLLKRFSGRSSLKDMDAIAWLARVLFTPQKSLDDKIFLVNQPGVLTAISIGDEGRGRFSFAELRPGLGKLHKLAGGYAGRSKSRPDRFAEEIMRLDSNVSTYCDLLDSFSFARPEETMTSGASRAPALVPLSASPDEAWLSPAQALVRGRSLPVAPKQEIEMLSRAARAYAKGDGDDCNRALEAFDRSLRNRLGPAAVRSWKISLEIACNRLNPFFKAGLAYGLALLLLIFSLAIRRSRLGRLGALCLLAGFLLQAIGLAARMAIMNRPPVTNLYESFVFVAWAGAGMGLLLSRLQKTELGGLAGGITGLVLLLIAGRYGSDGDTMGMLAAVLDSNLWLATHVVTIALGYAGCVVSGIIGHIVLIEEVLRPRNDAIIAATVRSLYAVLAFGLIFTCIGTLMGGIWADQSWGRFWGWDPKESGALLIIICCAVLLHARLIGWIGQIGLAAGCIGVIIAVVLAWFGVNLLGTGRHSYGLPAATAWWILPAFMIIELGFIAIVVPLAQKRCRP